MKKFKFTIQGNDYEVYVKSMEDGLAKVEVNGTSYKVELQKEEKVKKTPILIRTAVNLPKDAHLINKDSQAIYKVKAPLPGNIMQLFVKEGDQVAKDDPLLLYEAMKMENKLLAEKGGRIKSIKVQAGDAVLQDDVLLEIALNA